MEKCILTLRLKYRGSGSAPVSTLFVEMFRDCVEIHGMPSTRSIHPADVAPHVLFIYSERGEMLDASLLASAGF